jgi:hypothetical protein
LRSAAWAKDRSMTKMRWLLALLLVAIFAVVVSCVATWFLNSRSDRVIKQWHQPKEVEYKSFDPYTLSVIEGAIDWNNLSFPRRHYLFIGRGTESPSYGHYLDYTFHAGFEEVDAYIGQSTVEWTSDGLTFVEASGHRLFVPKSMFIGGR